MKINVDLIYPIGSLYLTTSIVSPEVLFGGTWTRITDDAYLKIVNTDLELGQLGGTSSDHKIPISSMPSHRHVLLGYRATSADATATDKRPRMYAQGSGAGWDGGESIQLTGGGQAYYPYYYGIYVWKRIA